MGAAGLAHVSPLLSGKDWAITSNQRVQKCSGLLNKVLFSLALHPEQSPRMWAD